MLSLRPSEEDRLRYREIRARYDELRGEEKDLWAELEAIRLANSRVADFDRQQAAHAADHSAAQMADGSRRRTAWRTSVESRPPCR